VHGKEEFKCGGVFEELKKSGKSLADIGVKRKLDDFSLVKDREELAILFVERATTERKQVIECMAKKPGEKWEMPW